jgi:hypothetical protein
MTTPFIEALRRIRDLTAEWPGDDMAAARVIGTVNAIAFGALAYVPEGTKPQQESIEGGEVTPITIDRASVRRMIDWEGRK